VIFALTGSLLFSLTATPVFASFLLRPGVSERDTLPVRWAKWAYEPALRLALRHPVAVACSALAGLIACLPLAFRLGGEFIPQLDEGDLIIVQVRPPSSSLKEAIADSTRLETALREQFPDEIRTTVSRIGRPEIGLEPAGVNFTDTWVLLNEPEQWTKAHTKDDLISQIDELCKRVIPGTFYSFSQPIELRFNELLSGVRADLGIGVFGDNLDVLQETADAIADVLRSIPGATGVKAQAIGGLPFLRIEVDRDRIARYGINASDVLDAVSALGGKIVGQVVEGQRRFPLQVRFGARYRNDIETIRTLTIADPQGRMIALEDLAEIRREDDTYEIWRKDRQRRVMVQSNVRGRDLASFVAEAQRRVAREVQLPRGYYLEWGGTFENLQSATKRLAIVVPLSLLLIFLVLYSTFQSIGLGALIFMSVPLGAIGGVLSLWLRGLNFSISAGVGFIALSGVAVLDGLVLVSAIRHLIEGGTPIARAVHDASMARLRPTLMTGLVASLGFVPMAFSHGAGAEVQRPLATVVIGGLLTSMILKLIVLPAIYGWFDSEATPSEPGASGATAS
jgi:heavy metal efflux system protein